MEQTEKKYVKPDVEEVVFEMTSNIAGNCGTIGGNHGSYLDCTFDIGGGFILFVSDNCNHQADDQTFCYHVNTPDDVVFSS